MKIIAAYLLAVLGGNTNPSADDLTHILNSGILSHYTCIHIYTLTHLYSVLLCISFDLSFVYLARLYACCYHQFWISSFALEFGNRLAGCIRV